MSRKSTGVDLDEREPEEKVYDEPWPESDEDSEYDWDSVDWDASLEDAESNMVVEQPRYISRSSEEPRVITRHPDRLKVLATTSLVILAAISMLSTFFAATMYMILFLSDTAWVEGWMLFVSAFTSLVATILVWMFVKNSVDRA